MDLKLLAIALGAVAIIGMAVAGVASSSTGHFIKTTFSGTFVEHSGQELETFGDELIQSVKLILMSIFLVAFIGVAAYTKSKS
jgi:hypothetical protein